MWFYFHSLRWICNMILTSVALIFRASYTYIKAKMENSQFCS